MSDEKKTENDLITLSHDQVELIWSLGAGIANALAGEGEPNTVRAAFLAGQLSTLLDLLVQNSNNKPS